MVVDCGRSMGAQHELGADDGGGHRRYGLNNCRTKILLLVLATFANLAAPIQ